MNSWKFVEKNPGEKFEIEEVTHFSRWLCPEKGFLSLVSRQSVGETLASISVEKRGREYESVGAA